MKRPLAVLTAALLCTSCAPAGDAGSMPQATETPTTAASPPVSLSAGGQPQAPGGTVPPTLGIAWDADSKKAAAVVAAKAMADFARPKTEATRWANDFARWLTAQATAAYSAVDPANIPATRVTGAVTLEVDESNGYGVTATVPTDAGPYRVHLLRISKDSAWKVNRLTPPV